MKHYELRRLYVSRVRYTTICSVSCFIPWVYYTLYNNRNITKCCLVNMRHKKEYNEELHNSQALCVLSVRVLIEHWRLCLCDAGPWCTKRWNAEIRSYRHFFLLSPANTGRPTVVSCCEADRYDDPILALSVYTPIHH